MMAEPSIQVLEANQGCPKSGGAPFLITIYTAALAFSI
ncbi:hypothetical protein BRO54_2047 [Geobacillus proteiniphilus]|uniref:Uncharacterized protein n=1 Tax=Geobacillus proteiniphilus TaxID=860353 RepID=A0A1Q5SYK5_9BACL|nr:hypothetical protein BRO54_2047 [Geobacillus proteiniphilus]